MISPLHHNSKRPGSVLIVVLVVVVLLSLSAYAFTSLMQTEQEATLLTTRQIQSKYLVASGVEYVRSYLSCLLYTSPSPRDATLSRMPSSA